MKNRRIFPRAERQTPTTYLVDGQPHTCMALDLAVGGACLLSDRPLESMEEIELCFELTPDWKVPALARPLWQKTQDDGKFLIGISYRPMRSSDKHLMGPWIHKVRKELGEEPLVPPMPPAPPPPPPQEG